MTIIEHWATIESEDWLRWQRQTHAHRARFDVIRAACPGDHPAILLAADVIDLLSQVVTAGALRDSLHRSQ